MKDNDSEEKTDRKVYDLLSELRKEKLFITTEKLNIQALNRTLKEKTDNLIKSAWKTTKQRLYLVTQREFSSQNYEHIRSIVNSSFKEARAVLDFPVTIKIENLLQTLRTQPEQLAQWLFMGEHLAEDGVQHVIVWQCIVTGLYSSCIFPDDTKYMLKLLYELAKLQLLKCDNPRKILKQGTCSFRNLYFIFNEVLPSAKFFLSATLEIPILLLLSSKELYLDLDPEKTAMRYNLEDNNLKNEFSSAAQYRKQVVAKLSEFTNHFICSLQENIYSFPRSIAWVVYQISKIITKSFGSKEASAIVTDLIFTLYICPAIVDPEQYCICDSQINEVARHNLMQVAQILQILALNKVESTDSRIADIHNQLDGEAVSNFVENVLFNLEAEETPPIDFTPSVVRDSALFSEEELNVLISFLQKVHTQMVQNDGPKKGSSIGGNSIEEQVASLTLPSSLESSPKLNKPHTNGVTENHHRKSNFMSMATVTKNHHHKHNYDGGGSGTSVLIFSLEKDIIEPVGLLSEEKVLNLNFGTKKDVMFSDLSPEIVDVDVTDGDPVVEKQSYANYQDEGSIGNTSDNLEAISEAASNHSVASSLELENEDQNDNLSDMISANVSGRGTPNISGRDTPSSQVNENEERPMPEARQADIAQPQPQISRQIRSEIDDKFCKFEIKKLLEGDETISLISETWSTDVLASDNETIDAGDSRIDRQMLPLVDQTINEVATANLLDISETQSESAWSTDVVASDTERLTEVDNDDAGSVAQSDDANSVAPSDDTRSETDENMVASINRRPSNPSNNCYVNHVNYMNYQEFRKMEIKNDAKSHTDNNANNVLFKSVTMSDTQQMAHNSLSFSEIKTTTTAFNSNHRINSTFQPIASPSMPSKDVAGPSGFGNGPIRHGSASDLLKQNCNFDERASEILLSNCSLNSSSSGSSSNSFENKNSHNDPCDQWESKQWLNSSGSSLNVTSTPSESTSELSVLSVTHNLVNPNNHVNILTKKSATVSGTRMLKPSASTGAIPKSISFDMSADKGDKGYLDDDHRSKRGGFFGKLRIGFRNRRGKSFRGNQDDYRMESEEFPNGSRKNLNESPVKINTAEVSEDILAKYRTKPFAENSPIKENTVDGKPPKNGLMSQDSTENTDGSNTFDDIKKKLRLVLSDVTSHVPKAVKENRLSVKRKIETILRLELGKARKMNQWSNIARIAEALRCVSLLNESSCLNLLESMREDFMQRSVYIQYLVCSRQELLFSESYLNGLDGQMKNEKKQCEEYLSMICVRKFVLEQENKILQFCLEFKETNLSDEKCDYLYNFYEELYSVMERSGPWHEIFRNQGDVIKVTLERCIMNKVYMNALHPNGDGDRHRDHVLYQHIEKLSRIISPDHKDLMIHKVFLREFPWIPAQDALKAMSAYRTPRDKVNCIVHCAKCIMDLLSFSQNAGSTTADDFTPVLVYVIIRVNPRDLLSTIQFVSNFYQSQLCGEELYWWTQFCSAVEYIKTMDYSD